VAGGRFAGHRSARRKRVESSTADPFQAGSPDTAWAVDFRFGATENDRPVRPASIVDDHTGERLSGAIHHRRFAR